MASNVTAESLLEKISVDHLECSICANRIRQPKVLECLHSFCLTCLQEFRRCQNKYEVTLVCPLCRHETILKGRVTHDLPTNFALTALVEEVTMMEQLLRKGPRMREEVPKCGRHPDQNLSYYCGTCEQLVCTTCSVLDHQTKKHTLVGLTEAVETCKREVAELVAEAEQNKMELNKAFQQTDKSRRTLEAAFDATKRKINMRRAAWIPEAQKLKEELETVYHDRLRAFETALAVNSKEAALVEQKLEEVGQLMAQASRYEILEQKKQLLHNVRKLTAKRPHKVPEWLSFLELTEGQGSIWRLNFGDEPKLETLRRRCKTLLTTKMKPMLNYTCQYLPFIFFVVLCVLFVRLSS